jgi:hypothetical protein
LERNDQEKALRTMKEATRRIDAEYIAKAAELSRTVAAHRPQLAKAAQLSRMVAAQQPQLDIATDALSKIDFANLEAGAISVTEPSRPTPEAKPSSSNELVDLREKTAEMMATGAGHRTRPTRSR